MAGLDYCARWLRCILLQWRMQFPAECAHECHQSCDCADIGASNAAGQSAETVLCAHQAQSHIGAVFLGRDKCQSEKVPQHGGEELWMPLECRPLPMLR